MPYTVNEIQNVEPMIKKSTSYATRIRKNSSQLIKA